MISAQRSVNSGFTLMEVMIVVVIAAVLLLVAFPSYQSYIAKANRAEAQSYLMQLAQRQQRFFSDARIYGSSSVQLNVTEPERVTTNYVVTFELSTNLPPAFLITAVPRSGSVQVGDGALSIDNAGAKLFKGDPW